MEKRIEKLLRKQNFDKELWIQEWDETWIMANAPAIQNLPIEKLYFSQLKTATILNVLGAFQNLGSNLKSLTLYNNKIKSGDVNASAHAICNVIQHLVTLFLDSCKMRSTELITIFDAIGQSNLQTLKLREVIFRKEDTEALADCIKRSQLVNLRLDKCSFYQNKLVLIMGSLPASLQTLCLRNVFLDDEAIIAISNHLARSQIIKLSLFGCTFADRKIITIMKNIQNSSLKILSLNCSIFDDTMEDIMKLACASNSHITKLDLGSVESKYNYGEIVSITNSIKKYDTLEAIGLNYIRIDDSMLFAICNAIENSTILSIKLWCCWLRSPQIIKICASIKKSHVTSFNLSANTFDITAIMTICDLLEQCSHLKTLKIMNGGLTNEFVELLLISTKKSELTCLDIRYNSGLSPNIKQKLKKRMCKQKLCATAFQKTKSADALIKN